MSYNSVSTVIALIPGIAITVLLLFGNPERVIEIIKRKSILTILALFCAVQVVMHIFHYPVVYKLVASMSMTTLITILYILEIGWPVLRLLR
jgi:hypothetical protein